MASSFLFFFFLHAEFTRKICQTEVIIMHLAIKWSVFLHNNIDVAWKLRCNLMLKSCRVISMVVWRFVAYPFLNCSCYYHKDNRFQALPKWNLQRQNKE